MATAPAPAAHTQRTYSPFEQGPPDPESPPRRHFIIEALSLLGTCLFTACCLLPLYGLIVIFSERLWSCTCCCSRAQYVASSSTIIGGSDPELDVSLSGTDGEEEEDDDDDETAHVLVAMPTASAAKTSHVRL